MTEWMHKSLRYAVTQVLSNTDYEAMDPIIEQQGTTCTHQALQYDLNPESTCVALCPDTFQSQSVVKCI